MLQTCKHISIRQYDSKGSSPLCRRWYYLPHMMDNYPHSHSCNLLLHPRHNWAVFPIKKKETMNWSFVFPSFFQLGKDIKRENEFTEFVADLPTNRPWWTSWFSGHAVDMIRCSALPILFHIKGSIFSKAEDYIVLVCESWPSRTIDAAAIVFSAV